jgi:hypothetical protein
LVENAHGTKESTQGNRGLSPFVASLKHILLSILAIIFSTGLFIVSYFATGWGAVLGQWEGACALAVGTTVYFVSLWIAIRSGIRALIATITILGVILGIIVILISLANTYPWKGLPVFVIVWIAGNGAFFCRALKRRGSLRSQFGFFM